MRSTLLDKYIQTCVGNLSIPVCGHMADGIKELPPVGHVWDAWPQLIKPVPLPNEEMNWPDGAMCLFSRMGVTQKQHKFCVDVGFNNPISDMWFLKTNWDLAGVLVYQFSPTVFDAVPLVIETRQNAIVMPEVQIHYEKQEDGWVWSKANTGPINATFHNEFIADADEEALQEVADNVAQLGHVISMYLGTYHEWLKHDGVWEIVPAKAPKAKYDKAGKVKKIYKAATVGYKTFIPKEKDNDGTDQSVAPDNAE